ncbi:hypothetical protein KIH27_13060 [Mycobacterium sp. M1]|uniref:Uncharacterized protein n=1 Tax=Mycolicibacter acidiphilus TaxID=2835306 RepID=A0ABS5RM01_9MYCO|nr:hypothetical protein [Mycolicibacter acidiphilus]MBS9534516.1 hypothetical protein [Mycolicibacter acidiphilus]
MRPWFIAPLALCASVLTSSFASADPVSSPDPSSPEGTAILRAAGADLTGQLGKPAKPNVKALRVSQGWAFLWAQILQPDGQLIDYSGTPFAVAAANGGKSKMYAALLHQNGDAWDLTASRVGPTDVAWDGWSREYGAPAAIFTDLP